ncbi:MAG TPA: 3-oxoacyl-ACP reductase FabG [Pyrinomonadaceae bacterium]|nr:3-oxoacyl-ACP reductase FabG [Pyrinomonadaceae bacterium]
MKLDGRTALITGGGRGIGRAVALAFAREGARAIVVVSRTVSEIEQVAREIREECRVEAAHFACDVSNADGVERAYAAASQFFGGHGADILVNNAGIAESAPITKTSGDLWQRHLSINLSGTFYFMRAALPSMMQRGWGRIINVASIAGKTGAPYIAAYTASKHGVVGLTRAAASEVAAKGITVNAVCPGYVETEMTTRAVEKITEKTGRSAEEALEALRRMSPQNRLVTPEEVAALAVLLASDEARGINGQAINVDGGSVLY